MNQINDLGFMYSEAGVAKFSIPENYFDRGEICSYTPTPPHEIIWNSYSIFWRLDFITSVFNPMENNLGIVFY